MKIKLSKSQWEGIGKKASWGYPEPKQYYTDDDGVKKEWPTDPIEREIIQYDPQTKIELNVMKILQTIKTLTFKDPIIVDMGRGNEIEINNGYDFYSFCTKYNFKYSELNLENLLKNPSDEIINSINNDFENSDYVDDNPPYFHAYLKSQDNKVKYNGDEGNEDRGLDSWTETHLLGAEAKNTTKIKLSKSQWEFMGRKAGWIKMAQGNKLMLILDDDEFSKLTDEEKMMYINHKIEYKLLDRLTEQQSNWMKNIKKN